eukprot:TRINITY_DN3157_c0_g2_i1.p1 TRINITY_DN3157_c0_g2~~TRINITY_DN3157_c0_g2_i1.p1  ORF type:complete len:165 (+),score=21.07 TRINITY_DN3157_c0_g2_i1:53-547(+)
MKRSQRRSWQERARSLRQSACRAREFAYGLLKFRCSSTEVQPFDFTSCHPEVQSMEPREQKMPQDLDGKSVASKQTEVKRARPNHQRLKSSLDEIREVDAQDATEDPRPKTPGAERAQALEQRADTEEDEGLCVQHQDSLRSHIQVARSTSAISEDDIECELSC